ncbi:inositol polyphosphate kinase family protein [Aureibacter tunicatorum]|uniref:Kinase n=1 Tax=Aureibacter tunicatorum TaxID=866807 RepID=A0AAE3XRS4_9BACT|nr:inositol polyphosphate kinase family protein [Aureibacter tunicatorum]MDR6240274.1 hypothetical protein [Aureibacter tunicatorum]BDD05845.1 hypothetical protein AUTU_33280 [Aureibacter tunicatorum]
MREFLSDKRKKSKDQSVSSSNTVSQRASMDLNDNRPEYAQGLQMKKFADRFASPPVTLQAKSQNAEAPIQMAGTKPNTFSEDRKYVIKLSSDREEFVYKHKSGLALDAVLPGNHEVMDHTVNREGLVDTVTVYEGNAPKVIKLKNPIPQPTKTKRLLVLDVVGHHESGAGRTRGVPFNRGKKKQRKDKIFMDVKLGHYTKSGAQFKLEGASVPLRVLKFFEHNIKDLKRKSRSRGFDIDAGNLSEFEEAKSHGGRRKLIAEAIDVILAKLKNIIAHMSQANVTFVGSSLLLVLNVKNPQDSDVRLIDPDHPVLMEGVGEEVLKEKPEDVLAENNFGSLKRPRTWDKHQDKWSRSFLSGFMNFYEWLSQESLKLKGDDPFVFY